MSLGGRAAPEGAGPGNHQVLVVVVGSTRIAFPASVVHAILQPGEVGASGVVAARGWTYPVRALADGFGLPEAADGPDTRIVLCGRDDRYRGFKVDQVLGMTDVDDRKVRPLPPQFMGTERTWFVGLMFFQETVAMLVNSEWLFLGEIEKPALAKGDRPLLAVPDRGSPQLPIIELEEATDAENAPWAEI
jgi:chemotaxis signal transduction protein